MGFFCSTTDPSLFIRHSSSSILILLLYVDDMLITRDNNQQINDFISQLARQFSIKDPGHLHHFLGIEVHKFGCDMFLSQHQYALDLVNIVLQGRIKLVKLDYHYIREPVALDSLETRFVTSPNQLADIFIKLLPKPPFQAFRIKLGLWPDPRPCLRGSDNVTSLELINQHANLQCNKSKSGEYPPKDPH